MVVASDGRTVDRESKDVNHVTFVPEMGGPFRSHGPKPRGSHGDRHQAGVDGSLNSGFSLLFPTARPFSTVEKAVMILAVLVAIVPTPRISARVRGRLSCG